MNHSQIVSFIWGVADLIRDTFKRGKYQDVILPLTVLRRLDCVLAPTKRNVLDVQAKYAGKIDNLDPQLRRASGFAFYNTSRYDFEKLLADAPHIAQNLRNYIAGFSPNMREVLEKFDFDNTISKLDESGLLFQVVQRFGDPQVNLHPDAVDNAAMGSIFEELIRKFNEALNENPGEHFTPRDVVHLMVDLLLAGDEERLRTTGVVLSVYDPCCGSGGMLTIAKEHLTAGETRDGERRGDAVNPDADIHLFGQEVNPETFAICKSDLFMKSADGRDAENVLFGSTLSNDRHGGAGFDYMIANPPYGKDWKRDQDAVRAEHDRGAALRFGPGLPRISDGQLLFLQHMLAHVKDPDGGGSRVAIIMNGSPLFTGDAGSGESEIRRWILENDLLEALIALPEQLFYNTGIATYVWVLTNRKRPERRGMVQLVDATSFWVLLRKSLGAKRREVPFERKQDVLRLLADFEDGATRKVERDGEERETVVSRVYPTTHFGFRKITVERPLRLDFQASPERIARLDDERAFANLAVSRKRGDAKIRDEETGRERQATIRTLLRSLPDKLFLDRAAFEAALSQAARDAELKLAAPVRKAILSALSERNDEAEICRDREGRPEPDPERRDTENVPLRESVETFFAREVKPHVPDAWIDTTRRDPQDGEVGIVGYEINFNRYFYEYRPPRPLEEIEADIQQDELPREVQQNIDMESFRIQRTSRGRIKLERHGEPLEPAGSKPRARGAAEELEALSRIIEALNERFGLNLGPEHRFTLEQLRAALEKDAGLDASAKVNTRENVRLTFDPKVEDKIQEIVETNFDLYKRITDDPDFGQALKNFLFDDYMRRHRRAEELLKLQESKTLEFKSSLRWNLQEDRKDDKHVTHAALKTIAAFLNTEGGDLLIGVDDDRKVLGIEHDRLDNDDKFMRHLAQAVRNGLGERAGTCIDPKTQIVEGRTLCLVSCQRSPEPVFLRWKGVEKTDGGDLYVRTGPGSVRLGEEDAKKYVATRFETR